jgi:hypothetical protein
MLVKNTDVFNNYPLILVSMQQTPIYTSIVKEHSWPKQEVSYNTLGFTVCVNRYKDLIVIDAKPSLNGGLYAHLKKLSL